MVGLTAATSTLSSAADYADAIKRRNEKCYNSVRRPTYKFSYRRRRLNDTRISMLRSWEKVKIPSWT